MANPIKQLINMNKSENYPIASAKAVGGADLPAVTNEDNGKVLSVNNGVWGVSSTAVVPTETIIAPEQTVTITEETDPVSGETIVLADGYNLPAEIPEGWSVTVNGTVLNYFRGSYVYVDGTTGIAVGLAENKLILSVTGGIDPASATPIPGSYTVKIVEAAETFPPAITSADNGKVLGVVDGKWALVSLT